MIDVPWWVYILVKSLIVLFIVVTTFAYAMLFERKILGWMQLRPGPNRVGPWGMLQPAADAVKMLFKEDLTPQNADSVIYRFAPFISLVTAMGVFAIIPFSESSDSPLVGRRRQRRYLVHLCADLDQRVRHLACRLGLELKISRSWVRSRSAAQMISYELAMTLSVVGVLILAGTTSLSGIVHAQQGALWFVVPQFVGFLIYITTAVAETNRTPFDLVEAETELVGGFHTEYSGLRFGLFFIAEYLNMISVSCLATLLFLGGWSSLRSASI